MKNGKSIWDQDRVQKLKYMYLVPQSWWVKSYWTRLQEIILDGGMGAFLTSVEVDSSPIWSGIANINSRDVVIDAHQVKFNSIIHHK